MTERPLSSDPTSQTASSSTRLARRFHEGLSERGDRRSRDALDRLGRSPGACGGSGTIKIGLVGCGGRGTGAAGQALTADSGVKLVAMADAFAGSARREPVRAQGLGEHRRASQVPKDRQYAGFDAYKHVIDQVDLVILTTPPHFRPLHLAYAVEKGINAFVEKPMAVDGQDCADISRRARTPRPKTCRWSTASAGAMTVPGARP